MLSEQRMDKFFGEIAEASLKTQETNKTLPDKKGEEILVSPEEQVPPSKSSLHSSIPLDNGQSAETNDDSPILRISSRIIKKPDRLNL